MEGGRPEVFGNGIADDPFWRFAYTVGGYSDCIGDLFTGENFEAGLAEDYLLPTSELFDGLNFSTQDEGEVIATDESSEKESKKKKNKGLQKIDRSRTLVSERRRRSRMREDLYALRSLVPNITKMDKASIIGDAVLYLQELQKQAENLKSEVSSLQESLLNREKEGLSPSFGYSNNSPSFHPTNNKIYQIDVIQTGKTEYFAKILSSKGKCVAALIHKALYSLTNIKIHTSHLAAGEDNYFFTFSFTIQQEEIEEDLPYLKVWIGSALLVEGFEFDLYQSFVLS